MPLPAIAIPAAAGTFLATLVAFVDEMADAVAYVTGERNETLDEVQAFTRRYEGHLARWAVGAVFEQMGLDLDASEGVNAQTVTKAVNAGPLAGTGIELSDLFDKDAIIRDLTRWGVSKAAESLGLPGGSVSNIRASLREHLVNEVATQLAAEAGPLLEGAPDAAQVAKIMAAVPPGSGWNEPRDFSPAGVSNRARQARFRASNRKHWELR